VQKHAGLRIVLRFCWVRKGLRGSDVLFGFGRAEAIRQLEQVISGSITPIVASQQNLQTGRRGCTSAPGDTLSEAVEEWKGEQVKNICLPRFDSQARRDAGLAGQLVRPDVERTSQNPCSAGKACHCFFRKMKVRPLLADTFETSRKLRGSQNLAKADIWTSRLLQRSLGPMRRSVVVYV